MSDATTNPKETDMTGTTTNKNGETTHRCSACGKRFPGTGKRGRPHKRCPACRKEK